MTNREETPQLQFAAGLSTRSDLDAAIAEAAAAGDELDGPADLAVAFVALPPGEPPEDLAAKLTRATGARCLVGCTAESIVGGGREVEQGPALALWLARLPGARLRPMHLTYERTPEGGTIVGWPDDLPAEWPAGAALLLLGDPFSFPADLLLERMNEDRPGVPVVGGMASAGRAPGENRLLLGAQTLPSGAAAVLLEGVALQTVVSQGCRPVGRHYVVTKAERNLIEELGGKPPLVQLRELFAELSAEEQALAQSGLHVGVVIDEYRDTFGPGDFLVRNVLGADSESGAIAVGDYVRAGQTVQFHLRDADSADADLKQMLAGVAAPQGPQGALLFTCNGRGTQLFDEEHHDAAAVQAALGPLPVAGFFAQGELGPLCGRNFIHGFTASLAIFGENQAEGN